MIKFGKIFLFILSISLIAAMFSIVGSADDAVYKITASDGTVTEYTNASGFVESFVNLNDGDKITLLANIEVKSEIKISGESEDMQRTVYLDLAGYGLHAHEKMAMICVGAYTELNVYSSRENAFIYVDQEGSGSLGGGIFTVGSDIGPGARINFGTMTVDGVEHPGSNITTFSSCVVQVGNENEALFYGDGGTHIANVRDWQGFICHRSSVPKVIIKNSNLLPNETLAVVSSLAVGGETVFENCTILKTNGEASPLLNNSQGTTTLKNCITNFTPTALSTTVQEGSLILEGKNIFCSDEFDKSLIKDCDGKVLAYTTEEYEFIGGKNKLECFGKSVSDSEFAPMEIDLPLPAYSTAMLVDEEDTVEYVWRALGREESYRWKSTDEPIVPFILTGDAKEGCYKPGWYQLEEEGRIVYNGGTVLDFNIKVSIEHDRYTFINIYIPAFLVDEAYLKFSSVMLNDLNLNKKAWEAVEVDGEKYYRASTENIEYDPSEIFKLILVCDFGEGKVAQSAWQISASKYFEKIHANEESFTEEELNTVSELEERLFGK